MKSYRKSPTASRAKQVRAGIKKTVQAVKGVVKKVGKK